MRCIAVPYLAEDATDDVIAAADLVFPGGIPEFTAAEAFDWLGRPPPA
jgi:hypothetical protein